MSQQSQHCQRMTWAGNPEFLHYSSAAAEHNSTSFMRMTTSTRCICSLLVPKTMAKRKVRSFGELTTCGLTKTLRRLTFSFPFIRAFTLHRG